jgi:hypothetical protein
VHPDTLREARLADDLDHLVYATPDLDLSVAELEERLGVRAAPGGQHPGRGTRNALIALSEGSYLEIVGPDPDQPAPALPRWFGIDTLNRPRLVTWALKADNLKQRVEEAARGGVRLGPVVAGSRTRSDGVTLAWECTDPAAVVGGGLVPFFINWGDSPHPAASAPAGPTLVSLRGEHPELSRIREYLAAIGVALPVAQGPRPSLIATFRTTNGIVELR